MKNRRILLLAVLGTLLPAACILFSSQPAAALSRTMPDPADMLIPPTPPGTPNNGVYIVVSRRSDTNPPFNGLYAPTARVNIYVKDPTSDVRILDAGYCGGEPDARGVRTRFRLSRTDADERALPAPYIYNEIIEADECTTLERPLTGLTRSRVQGHEDYFVAQLDVTHLGDDDEGKINAFKVRSMDPDGIVGYTDNGNAKFALQDRITPPAGQGSLTDFSLPFAPDCKLTGDNIRAELHWFDDDWGNDGAQWQDESFRTVLREYDKSDGVLTGTRVILPRGGDQRPTGPNSAEQTVEIRVREGHRYIWTWENVSKTNGIQFRLPFDSFNAVIDCPPPTSNVKCVENVLLTPGDPSPGQSFTVRASFTYEGSAPTRPTYTMNVSVQGAPPYNNVNYGVDEPNRRISFTTPQTRRPAGTYKVIWTFTGPAGLMKSCEADIVVTNKPYFRVYGGDVLAGSGFGNGCTPTDGATIIGWNRGSLPADSDFPASSPYGGAGVQLAAFALGAINDFASAATRSIPPNPPNTPLPPKGLSFANTAGTGTYGGTWDRNNVTCASNYFADAPEAPNDCPPTDPATVNLNTLNGGHNCPGVGTKLKIGNSPIDKGKKITIFVNGDVAITGNIFVNRGLDPVLTYANINEIPSIRIIARNIYIASNVNQIDAVLIAQPDGNAGGTIYTCSDGGFAAPNKSQMINACRNKLTVNGAMIAQRFRFFRSPGGFASGNFMSGNNNEPATSPNIAEVIQYNPEVWLTNPAIQSPFPSPNQTYTSQPPIL